MTIFAGPGGNPLMEVGPRKNRRVEAEDFFGYAARCGQDLRHAGGRPSRQEHGRGRGGRIHRAPHTPRDSRLCWRGWSGCRQRRIPYKEINFRSSTWMGPWNAAHSSYWR
jgi:hypothetical protein